MVDKVIFFMKSFFYAKNTQIFTFLYPTIVSPTQLLLPKFEASLIAFTDMSNNKLNFSARFPTNLMQIN